MVKARYIRISTGGQKIERQLKSQFKNEKLFIDTCSGTIPFRERENASKLLQAIYNKEVTYLSIDAIDRLGRNLIDILMTLNTLENGDCIVKVDNIGIESLVKGKPSPAFKMIISVMANIAEMERETMLERQKQGIAIAKAKGVYKGRLKGSKDSDLTILRKYKSVVRHLNEGISLRKTAKLNDISVPTVQKVKRIMKTT